MAGPSCFVPVTGRWPTSKAFPTARSGCAHGGYSDPLFTGRLRALPAQNTVQHQRARDSRGTAVGARIDGRGGAGAVGRFR